MDETDAKARVKKAQMSAPREHMGEESAALRQMSTLVGLMKQQMEWTMRAEEGRREQGMGAQDALEMRMRKMEVVCCRTYHYSI